MLVFFGTGVTEAILKDVGTTPHHVIAAIHESSQVTADLQESSQVTVDHH